MERYRDNEGEVLIGRRTLAEAERDFAMQQSWRWEVAARRWKRMHAGASRIIVFQSLVIAAGCIAALVGWAQ